jgi:5-methylcytosine-specific restriction endonuclease McrA
VTPDRQLVRGERRYRRKVASPKQWQAIIAAKGGPCRVCNDPASNGRVHGSIHFHHLVARARGGDDVADNIVPLCGDCHDLITRGNRVTARLLARTLTLEERRYVASKPGGS